MDKKAISRAGFDMLAKEMKELQEIERPAILRAIQVARELGDLSENAEYSSARERQRNIDARIRYLEGVIGNSQIIDTSCLSGDRVVFGARVTVEDEDGKKMQFQILSDIEADGKNVIACTSPFGRAIIGKSRGDAFIVRTPSGDKEYDILEVGFN